MSISRRAVLSMPAVIPGALRAAAHDANHVIVISLDGFPAYALEDPRLPVPTIRRLMREGASAPRMKTSNPAVTWSVHTALVTGVPARRNGMIYNGKLIRRGPKTPPRVEPYRPKTELVQAPTVYDVAHAAGLTTAQVDWVAIQDAPTITWQFAEWPSAKGAIEKEMVAAGMVTPGDIADFTKAQITWRDRVWTEAAAHIFAAHRPNLLLYHNLNLDSTHHRYGPRNLASYTAIAFADDCVRELLEAVEKSGIKDRTTVIVLSDHGLKSHARSIRPNALFREMGLLKTDGNTVECDAWAVSEGGTAMIYVTDPANRAALVPRLREACAALEGVERVIGPEGYEVLGYPDPARNDQMSDLVLAAKNGYGFSDAHAGAPVVDVAPGASPGQHGFLNSDPDMDAIFVAWGQGIRKGARAEGISNLDVAPTVARLLGLEMKGVAGRVLAEILA